ncbi:MAG: HD domain-containing protein [Desulfobacterales bacterium]|nr:HD domain-containing protein [Desulfobacterales bacterium]
MEDYFVARESQVHIYKEVPLYYQAKKEEFALYKKAGDILDSPRLNEKKHPQLFIKKSDKGIAVKELFASLNRNLEAQVLSTDLQGIRNSLQLIVSEAIETADSESFGLVPETIEVMFEGFSKRSELLESLLKMKSGPSIVVEHTINVLLLTLRFGFYHQYEGEDIKRLALCALLHDLGTSEVNNKILEADRRLTDKEYEDYTAHASLGCDLLLKQSGFDPLVATVAQEHHERIDGSGYPYGKDNPCFESQLIGLIDCYEPLTYRDRTHRKAKKPFDSLQLLKEEVLEGKFDSRIFKDLCSSLTVKA